MKDYKEVVQNRYNSESDHSNSIYAADKPIGKYLRKNIYASIHKILSNYAKKHGALNDKLLLDVGCGNGEVVQQLMSEGFLPQNSYGIDLSETRIKKAEKLETGATFICGNGLTFQLDKQFDVITSFDMYSHIVAEDEIVTGLKNVRDHLAENGIFIWYDIYSDDHFNSPENTDSWGFNLQQMEALALKAGFKKQSHSTLFKRFFGKYQSVYQAGRIPFSLLTFLEKVIPGKPGNVVMVFTKS